MSMMTGTVNSGPDNPANVSINSQADFAYALLSQLGIQPNNGNVTAVVAWERAEGGNWNNSAHFNPLNTTQQAPGSTSINGVGVQAYQSWSEGLAATVQTLQNGRYGPILAALQGSDPYAVANAVGASPWGTPNFSNLIGSSAGSTTPSPGVAALAASPLPAGVAGSAVDDHCLIKAPSLSTPVGSVGGGCLLGTPPARAILGSALIVAGVAVGVIGLAVIVGAGLKNPTLAAGAQAVRHTAGSNSSPRTSRSGWRSLTSQEQIDSDNAGAAAERSAREQAADPEFQRQRRQFAQQGRAARRASGE